MPEQAQEQEVVEHQQQQQGDNKSQQESQQEDQHQIDWETEENPYKKRYGDSQSQIQPLVRTLSQFADYDHNTKSWKPKSTATPQQQEDVEKILEGYDPEFRKSLGGYVSKQIQSALSEYQKSQVSMTEYNSSMMSARSRAIEEFGEEFDFVKGGKLNVESPLYKLANEILVSKYVQNNPDGSFHRYSNPEAEYLATVEAYAIMAKRSKQTGANDKTKLSAIQGKGTKSSTVKKGLGYEEYMKLSDEQKDAYDLQQMS